MRPDLPWNVAGIPLEAREAARAAARREGLSVGEWLTRRILRSFGDPSDDIGVLRESRNGSFDHDDAPATRRDTAEMLAHVSRTEEDSSSAYRRIEDQLRAVARRLEATERSQSESNRAMSKAAAEINIATREQAQAFDQLGANVVGLSERLDRVERQSTNETIKDAVKGLHQGLTRLADQVSQTANKAASQISTLASNVESVAGQVAHVRQGSDALARAVEDRLSRVEERLRATDQATESHHSQLERLFETRQSHLDERVRSVEALTERHGQDVDRALSATVSAAQLQEVVGRLQSRETADSQSDRRLINIERTLADLVARIEAARSDRAIDALDEKLRSLGRRIDDVEKAKPAAAGDNIAAPVAPVVPPTVAPIVPEMPPAPAPAAAVAPPQPLFDAPPFAESPFPTNAPSLQATPETFLPQQIEPNLDIAPLAEPPPAAPQFAPAGAAESFLAAARRSAQAAAAQAEAERGTRGIGGFAWNVRPETSEKSKTRLGLIGFVALVLVLLVVVGTLFSRRAQAPASRMPDVSSVFNQKPATPTQLKPSTPQADIAPAAQAPTTAAPQTAPSTNAASPRTARESANSRTAPSSPTIPASGLHAAGPKEPAKTKPSSSASATQPSPVPAATAQHAKPAQTAALPALDRLTALASAGNPKAETIVGLKYLDGDGVAVNEAEAAKWLERAAQHGQAVAQYRLGTLYERGRGVAADPARALHWYQVAAEAGNRKAMHNLAVAYAQGSGAPKDFAEAARWFSKAAALGLADSQFNLAVLYERGLGVPQSLLDAYKWYAIAAAAGDTESKSRLDVLATQLSADDRAAAQRSADQFKAAQLDPATNVQPQMGDLGG